MRCDPSSWPDNVQNPIVPIEGTAGARVLIRGLVLLVSMVLAAHLVRSSRLARRQWRPDVQKLRGFRGGDDRLCVYSDGDRQGVESVEVIQEPAGQNVSVDYRYVRVRHLSIGGGGAGPVSI